MILGSKHVDFKCFNVKFYVSALVGVIIKVLDTLRFTFYPVSYFMYIRKCKYWDTNI